MRLTVLSPHRDDAVFSLAISLQLWRARGVDVSVVNFFTCSAYAPWARLRGGDVSSQRRREDKRALLATCGRVRIQSAGMMDAPLRLGIPAAEVCRFWEHPVRDQDTEEMERWFPRIQPVIAPLALGDHIDHHTVREAAIDKVPADRLAFYEDLPYATWTSEDAILKRVADAGGRLCEEYVPVVLRAPGSQPKRRLCSLYASQITAEEARAIARYANQYGKGERIWIPRHSRIWQSLVRNPQRLDERPLRVRPFAGN